MCSKHSENDAVSAQLSGGQKGGVAGKFWNCTASIGGGIDHETARRLLWTELCAPQIPMGKHKLPVGLYLKIGS